MTDYKLLVILRALRDGIQGAIDAIVQPPTPRKRRGKSLADQRISDTLDRLSARVKQRQKAAKKAKRRRSA